MNRTTVRDSQLASIMADMVAVEVLVPWACPAPFEPDPRYELCEVIGATNFSLVYLANDKTLSDDAHQAQVVIKITRGVPSAVREALLGRRVTHENVVRILGRGECEAQPYVIMEYVDGGTLEDLRVPLAPRRAARMVEQVANGIQALHSAGVTHLDLKPGNVLMDAAGVPKVSDFGLSVDGFVQERLGSVGTLGFMAPEQFRGEPGAPPADVYALGGLLFYLLTGRVPNGATRTDAEKFLRSGGRVATDAIRGQLGAVCARAMEPEPDKRHPSAAHFAEELARWRQHLPVESARVGPVRRAALLIRRRPAAATLLTCAAAIAVTAGAVVVRERARELEMTIREQAIQIETEREAKRIAAKDLEDLRANARTIVKRAAVMMLAVPGPTPSDTVLPIQVWLEWLTGRTVISNLGEIELAEQRVPALQSMVVQYEALKEGQGIPAAMCRFGLAQSLLMVGAYGQAADTLDELESRWPGPRGRDAFWDSADAMRQACTIVNALPADGRLTAEQNQQLRDLIEHLRRRPDAKSTLQLLEHVRERHEQIDPDSAPTTAPKPRVVR